VGPWPRIQAVATAVPANVIHQDEVRQRIDRVFAGRVRDLDRFMPIYGNAGVETRYSCVPLEWYEQDYGWAERNALYVEHSLRLLTDAALRCLDQAGLDAPSIDTIVTVSTTGIATPSLDAALMERVAFRRTVSRLPIFGLGCAGGVLGLARAASLAQAAPGSRVLCLVVEPCSLAFRRRDVSKSNVVATALFGDGAAAVLISTDGAGSASGPAPGPAIVACGEHTWPDTLDVMGWGVDSDGLSVIFSRDIPSLIRRSFKNALDEFLAAGDMTAGGIDQFLCHPGGAKVLDALEDVLGMEPGGLVHSRDVLRDYGNMSAVTVLFVLARALSTGTLGRRVLMSALGPGFTVGFLVLDNDAALPRP
jgi:alkylresorcinol/alkylpyrone synthase